MYCAYQYTAHIYQNWANSSPMMQSSDPGLTHSATFTGMALCFYSNKGWHCFIMLHGITQVKQNEYPGKIFPTAMEWSEVQQYVTEQGKYEGFDSCNQPSNLK